MPPKNMISVTRKSHMPKVEVAFCCSRSAKWCFRLWTASSLSCNFNPLVQVMAGRINFVVVVGFPGDNRGFFEVEGGRRGCGLPLESGGTIGIRPGILAVLQAPCEVNHRHQEAHRQD